MATRCGDSRTLCLFDAVGTLLSPRRPVPEVYRELGRRHGFAPDLQELGTRLQAGIAREIWSPRGGRTSEARERVHWRRVVAEAFASPRARHALFRDLWDYYAQPEHWQVYPDVAACLTALDEQGIRLAIASNFDSRLYRLARQLPSLTRIEQIYVSSDIGWRKPDPRFFATIAAAESQQTSIWMIGDRLEQDVYPADRCGWRAVWLRRNLAAHPQPEWEPTIATLHALPRLILEPSSTT